MRGAEETSSQPSEPAPLIQASSPLTIPSSPSLKTTIRSKYSHCMFSLRLPAEPSIYVASRCANDAATPPADGSAKGPRPPASSLAPRAATGAGKRATRPGASLRRRQVLREPRGGGLAGREVEAQLAVVEPAR